MLQAESPTFGVVLRRHRHAVGLTQEELAERAGLSVRGISDLERDVKQRPHRDTLELLAEALQLGDEDRAAFVQAARGGRFRMQGPDAPNASATNLRTFLVADVRGYTRFTQERGDEAGARLVTRFAALARESAVAHGGEVIELRGDEALVVFPSAREALRAGIDLLDRCAEAARADPAFPLPVGIGVDAGEAVRVEDGYRGGALNLAARLCSLAAPGEVLASEGVIHLARRTEGLRYVDYGSATLKGFTEPVRVVHVLTETVEEPLIEPLLSGSVSHETEPVIGGFLGSAPASALVGRAEELGRLVAMLEDVRTGAGRLVTIAGEPGAGKTRLAQELTLRLSQAEFLMATGRCSDRHGTIPYYPFLEALPTLYAGAPAALRREATERWAYLAPLLPDDLPAVQANPTDPQGDQQRVFRAVTRFLLALAEQRPVAILLDDIHWSDTASLDLLRHLAEHTRGSCVLLAGMYRDVEVRRRHPLQATLRELSRDDLLERIAVRRFNRAGTALLIASRLGDTQLSDELVDLVHEHAEGNPFFTHEIVRSLMDRGDISIEGGVWQSRAGIDVEVPESVRSVIDDRVARLPEASQTLLPQASVLGPSFSFDELLAMSGSDVEEAEGALDAAVEAELLDERDRDGYAFSHVLVQQTLYADLSGRRKRRLHLAAGRALENLPARQQTRAPAELAWHFLEGDDAERAFYWTLLAGNQAESAFAHVEAEAQYRAGIELADRRDDTSARATVREKLSVVLLNSGRHEEGLPMVQKAASLYRLIGDLEGEARAVCRTAVVLAQRAQLEEARTLLNAIQPRLEAVEPSSGLAEVYFQLGYVEGLGEDIEAALRYARLSSEAANLAEDLPFQLFSEMFEGNVLYIMGRSEEAERVLRRVLERDDGHVLSPDRRASVLHHLGSALAFRGDLAGAVPLFQRSLQLVERLDMPLEESFTLAMLSEFMFRTGEWEAARRHAQRALDLAHSVDPHGIGYGDALGTLGKVLLWSGMIEDGIGKLTDVLGGGMAAEPPTISDAAVTLADWNLLHERPDDALNWLADLPREGPLWTMRHLDTLGRVYLALGRVADAEAMLSEWVERRSQYKESLVGALWSLGMVHAARDRWAEAEASFTESIALAREMPYPFAEARALCHWGLEELRREDSEKGQELLGRALTIFKQLGATPYVERAEQALATRSHFR